MSGHGKGRIDQQSPLLDKSGVSASSRGVVQMTEERRRRPSQQHPNQCYTVFVDLINMLMCSAEIALVLYLTIHHFLESMGVIAVAMLAPILLNFVGVTYFFSDNNERMEFERAGTTRFTRDMLQIPVLGPVFTAVKVLMISTGIQARPNIEYERFEACAVKMREAQTFFSAAPEAMVQLAVLLNTTAPAITLTHILEALVVIVSIFTLAEANVYALRSNYFRLFHTYEEGDWRVHESFGYKCILFFHSFFSIGSRIAASACLIAAAQCILRNSSVPAAMEMPSLSHRRRNTWENKNPVNTASPSRNPSNQPSMPDPDSESTSQLGFIIGVTVIGLIIYHMLVYYISRVLRYVIMRRDVPGGCYESINYGWRSTILHTGFQSKNIATQIWFYVENCVMFTIWWFSIEYFGKRRQRGNATHLPMTYLFTAFTVCSLFFLFAAVGSKMHRLESPFKDSQRETTNNQSIS